MFLRLFSRRQIERDNLFRNFIFGVEDSLVSTVGLLSGVAISGSNRQALITTGIILIFVEAFSMGIGTFISEDSSGRGDHSRKTHARIAKSSAVMFTSYLLAGLIPLSPYGFLPPSSAVVLSIALSLLTLFALGILSARRSQQSRFRGGLEMLALGGLATMVGVVIGSLLGV